MKSKNHQRLINKARKIRFLLLDVDGVMTDGTIYLDSTGQEMKGFHIHDGLGIHQVQQAGVQVGIIIGRSSEVVTHRAHELDILEVHQNAVDKIKVYDELLKRYDLTDTEMGYVGDDIIDLPILERVGLAVAVANASPLVKRRVHWVTKKPGGQGAIREVTDLILNSRTKAKV